MEKTDFYQLINRRISTLLIDLDDPLSPSLIVVKYSRFGNDASAFERIIKLNLIVMEICARRFNCQLNGVIVVVDCDQCPLWLVRKLLNPATLYKNIHNNLPLRVKAFHLINFPLIGRMVWQVLQPIISYKLKKKFNFYGSDWLSLLKNNVDPRLLPKEFGGLNGPLEEHEKAFINELYAELYFLNDD